MIKSILITGSNIGIGKEAARQLALKSETTKVILACRNLAKAEAAKKDLELSTGKSIFEILIMDVSKTDSVRNAVSTLDEAVDAVILNAGGLGGDTAGKTTPSGMNELSAMNVLGHVVLVEEMLKQDKLNKAVLLASSEAVRGVKQMGMKPPKMNTSSEDEFASVLDGSFFGNKFNAMQAYGYVKYAATMWMFSLARKHPSIKFVCMSPGSTSGTGAVDNAPALTKFMFRYIMSPIVMPLMGIVHKVEVGAKRFVDGIVDDQYKSGVFYASKAGKLTGPVVDQSTLYPDLTNTTFQENASKAIHRFIK
jgi:NAD(P)-dependent dehydrogenase (short-subunit alcohol dehydrogenase family)